MRVFLLLSVYFLNLTFALGQKIVNNTLTANHQNIAGTKVSLISPKGFHKAANFLGLQQEQSGSTIMIVNIPGPFSEVTKGLTKEGFLSQGVVVKETEKITLNNLPAILVTGEQNAHGQIYTKFVLAFGTGKETIMINGASPNNLKEIGEEIKTSLLTTYYAADKKINPLEIVDFEINIKESKLTFANSIGNGLMFNVDGKIPTQSADKTSLLIAKAFSNVTVADKKLFSLNRIKQLPIEILKINSTAEITIDGISGYEILADGKDKKSGEQEKVYQVILFSDSLYYLIIGTTNKDYDKNIAVLKQVTKTFKRK